MDFELDPLDRDRARAEARSRLFSAGRAVTVGRYVLARRLGAGSWGTVYAARDPLTERTVAVKVMHRSTEPEHLEAWRREAQMLASLQHPNLIEIYDVGEHEGRGFLVTEWVPEGRTLADWSRQPTATDEELARRSVGLADALATLHRSGVLHRDIKPDNILVDARGTFRLADFGLAVDMRTGLDEGMHGTPAFMPLEVRSGARASETSDVYGLCASLWFASTGALPFEGTMSRRLRRVLRRGLESEPGFDAESLAAALDGAAASTSTLPTFATTTVGCLIAFLAVAMGTSADSGTRSPSDAANDLYARGAFSAAADAAHASWRDAEDPEAEIELLHSRWVEPGARRCGPRTRCTCSSRRSFALSQRSTRTWPSRQHCIGWKPRSIWEQCATPPSGKPRAPRGSAGLPGIPMRALGFRLR